MLASKSILVVEDNIYLALDLSWAIEDLDGKVLGPARTVAEGLALVGSEPVAGAILGCNLPDGDVLPLAEVLAMRQVPFVLHATAHLPADFPIHQLNAPVLVQPVQPQTVLERLLIEMQCK